MDISPYDTWIATLPEDQRMLVQVVMARLMEMLDDRYNDLAGEVARWGRRHTGLTTRVAELQLRLDQYEVQQWTAAKEAIEQFAATQVPPELRDQLIETIYRLATEVEQLKAKQAGDGTA